MENMITVDQLIDLVQNRLSDDVRKTLEKNIEGDEWAQRMIKLFRTLSNNCQPIDFYTPSDKFWKLIIANSPFLLKEGQAKKPVMARPKIDWQAVKDIISVPVFGLQYGTRGLVTPELTYETETCQINLELFQTGQPSQSKIIGELLTIPDSEPIISPNIQLEHPRQGILAPQIGQFGDFLFESVQIDAEDLFDMTIELADEVVFIENLPLGQLSRLS